MKKSELLKDGILRKNPIFVQLLGTCSTLAVSTSLSNALCMGIAVTLVLICSNCLISLLRKLIPSEIRIASYIVIISGFVSMVELLLEAFLPSVDKSLGVFIPLIVVNCIILGRAEAFASKNNLPDSFFDGLFMGLGYTCALLMVSFVRELFGSGTLLGYSVLGSRYIPIGMITNPSGAFIILGSLCALVTFLRSKFEKGGKEL